MNTDDGHSVSIEIGDRLSAVGKAAAFVEAFCDAYTVARRDRVILRLLVEELVTNTLRHGDAPTTSCITIALSTDSATKLYYADRGRPFDPLQDTPAAAEPGAFGGYGWSLIRHFCELIEYRREQQENRLWLTLKARTDASN